jgi:thiol-disulfide isomerase/thioredoxin
MSDTKQRATAPSSSSPLGFFVVVLAIALVAFVVMRSRPAAEPEAVGVPLPPLEVAGWFNTTTPITTEDLRGKWVVLDCWFVDCGPCRAEMPHLVEFHKRFRDQGIAIVGITPDSGDDATRAEQFAASIPGLDWPIGFGAQLPLDALGVYQFPTMILFDRAGRSVWAGHDVFSLEQATLSALASQR